MGVLIGEAMCFVSQGTCGVLIDRERRCVLFGRETCGVLIDRERRCVLFDRETWVF